MTSDRTKPCCLSAVGYTQGCLANDACCSCCGGKCQSSATSVRLLAQISLSSSRPVSSLFVFTRHFHLKLHPPTSNHLTSHQIHHNGLFSPHGCSQDGLFGRSELRQGRSPNDEASAAQQVRPCLLRCRRPPDLRLQHHEAHLHPHELRPHPGLHPSQACLLLRDGQRSRPSLPEHRHGFRCHRSRWCRYRYRSRLRRSPPGRCPQPISPWPALLIRHSWFRFRRGYRSLRSHGCHDVQVRLSVGASDFMAERLAL